VKKKGEGSERWESGPKSAQACRMLVRNSCAVTKRGDKGKFQRKINGRKKGVEGALLRKNGPLPLVWLAMHSEGERFSQRKRRNN